MIEIEMWLGKIVFWYNFDYIRKQNDFSNVMHRIYIAFVKSTQKVLDTIPIATSHYYYKSENKFKSSNFKHMIILLDHIVTIITFNTTSKRNALIFYYVLRVL